MIPPLPRAYVDHLVEPVGVGDVSEPNAAGEIGSMVGGLGVRITLAYRSLPDDTAVISDIRSRSFGSAAPIAPLSWLVLASRGQTWEQACRHSLEEVLAALSDGDERGRALPPAVRHGAEFAVKAMRRALGIALHGNPADLRGEGILVCRCLGVGDRRIRQAIRGGARDPEAIGAACRACTGCRSCRPDLLALLDEEAGDPWPTPDPALHPVARIVLARAGPLLRGLGVPLLGAIVDGDVVRIRLGPSAPGASLTPVGAVALTRHLLRETVHDAIRVEPCAAPS